MYIYICIDRTYLACRFQVCLGNNLQHYMKKICFTLNLGKLRGVQDMVLNTLLKGREGRLWPIIQASAAGRAPL